MAKDSAKGTVASNYRAIACLPIMWKLLTGIFAEVTYDHLFGDRIEDSLIYVIIIVIYFIIYIMSLRGGLL